VPVPVSISVCMSIVGVLVCEITHSNVRHDSVTAAMGRFRTCAMMHSCVWQDSFTCDMIYPHAR